MTIAPEGRRLLRLEVRNASVPIEKKPSWIKTTARMGPEYRELQQLVKSEGLHTVCQEAGCPNIFECWEDREATFLIGGDSVHPALRLLPDRHREARRLSTPASRSGLPSRCRRWAFAMRRSPASAATTFPMRAPGCTPRRSVRSTSSIPIQASRCWHPTSPAIPTTSASFSRPSRRSLRTTWRPSRGSFKRIRPGFRYERSLDVLRASRSAGLVTKSNLILGMGETRSEISEALRDLYDAGAEIVTITQYLRPSPRHHPVDRWVKPEEFVELADEATAIGFAGVMSGPLVRSSYRAGRLYRQAIHTREALTVRASAV